MERNRLRVDEVVEFRYLLLYCCWEACYFKPLSYLKESTLKKKKCFLLPHGLASDFAQLKPCFSSSPCRHSVLGAMEYIPIREAAWS